MGGHGGLFLMSIWRDATSGLIVRDSTSGEIERCADCPCDPGPVPDCTDCDVPPTVSVTVSGWAGFASQFNGTYVLDWAFGCQWQATFSPFEGSCNYCDPDDTAVDQLTITARVFSTSPVRWQVSISQARVVDVAFESYNDGGSGCILEEDVFFTPPLSWYTPSGLGSDQCASHTLNYLGADTTLPQRDADCNKEIYTIPATVSLTI